MSGMTTTQYPSDERRYTPQEVAALWQCCIETVYDLLRRGRLKGFKIGRDWRVPESAIQAYEQAPENQIATTYSKPENDRRRGPKQPAAVVPRVVFHRGQMKNER